MKTATDLTPTSLETHHAISMFLSLEARLLDERRFEEWLDCLAADIWYWAPVRQARMPREQLKEFEQPYGGAHFDDNKAQLEQRVRKLGTNRAWSDVPASRTRHLISNVEAFVTDVEGQYEVYSNFHVYRTRGTTYQDSYVGARQDTIRADGDADHGFLVSKRTIILDQTVLLGNNMAVFF